MPHQEKTISDLPRSVHICEQGPREGFQFEKGPIPTARKIELYKRHNVPVDRGSIMAAFGCNFEGDISVERVLNVTQQIFDLLTEAARLAEDIVGHPLPGSVMKGGTLRALREKVRAAAWEAAGR